MVYEGIFKLISYLPYYNFLTSFIGEEFIRIVVFTAGIIIYGIVILEFYSTLTKRDLFQIKISAYSDKWERFSQRLVFIFKYTIAFPFYTFFWFLIFSFFLIMISKSLSVYEIFFVSIVIISSTRAIAYYNEELAKDIAKIIPLSLLGLFIIDPTYFSPELIVGRILEFIFMLLIILKFLLFTILLEWTLRILYSIKIGLKNKKNLKTI